MLPCQYLSAHGSFIKQYFHIRLFREKLCWSKNITVSVNGKEVQYLEEGIVEHNLCSVKLHFTMLLPREVQEGTTHDIITLQVTMYLALLMIHRHSVGDSIVFRQKHINYC